MTDDYLWDGSGEPDPEIQRLEFVLRRFRHNRPAPQLLVREGLIARWRSWFAAPQLAAVAAVILVAAGAWLAVRPLKLHVPPGPKTIAQSQPAWDVERVNGIVKIGASRLGDRGRLAPGEWLETDAASRAKINAGQIGEVEVEPRSRLRLVATGPNEHRLALARGTIHARIWAPPGQFFVETPSAVAVDLGCAYTLQVDAAGAGLVRVTFGWVGFELDGRESFIPAGAFCPTRPGVGPGTPYYDDTSQNFRAALTKLDFENADPEDRALAIGVVLTEARKRDALTLWHLLSRVRDSERSRVYTRLAALVVPPPGVTRDGIMRLDKPMLDLWWDELGLGDSAWWQTWKRSWPPQTK